MSERKIALRWVESGGKDGSFHEIVEELQKGSGGSVRRIRMPNFFRACSMGVKHGVAWRLEDPEEGPYARGNKMLSVVVGFYAHDVLFDSRINPDSASSDAAIFCRYERGEWGNPHEFFKGIDEDHAKLHDDELGLDLDGLRELIQYRFCQSFESSERLFDGVSFDCVGDPDVANAMMAALGF